MVDAPKCFQNYQMKKTKFFNLFLTEGTLFVHTNPGCDVALSGEFD
jgi:hypothetical protein